MVARLLEIHPAALEELKSATSWYLDRSAAAPVAFVADVDRAINLVMKSPTRWPSGEHETRKFVLQRFPFALIYREQATRVQVLAVAHGHRRPGYWKNRLWASLPDDPFVLRSSDSGASKSSATHRSLDSRA